jgi:hypothetical protein
MATYNVSIDYFGMKLSMLVEASSSSEAVYVTTDLLKMGTESEMVSAESPIKRISIKISNFDAFRTICKDYMNVARIDRDPNDPSRYQIISDDWRSEDDIPTKREIHILKKT